MKGYKRESEQSNLGSDFDRHDMHARYWRIGPRYPKSIASTSFVLVGSSWPSRTNCVITYSCSLLARNYEARNILYVGAGRQWRAAFSRFLVQRDRICDFLMLSLFVFSHHMLDFMRERGQCHWLWIKHQSIMIINVVNAIKVQEKLIGFENKIGLLHGIN